MCIRCSGIHRNLGVHISFVRSVSLDEWQTKHVKNSERWGRQCAVRGLRRACSRLSLLFSPPCLLLPVVRWGNRRANEYWEATVPEDYYIPDENDSVATVERCAPLVRSSNLQLQIQQPMAPPACPPPPHRWIRDKYEKRRFAARAQPAFVDDDYDLNRPLLQLLGPPGAAGAPAPAAAAAEDKPKKLKKAPSSSSAAALSAKPTLAAPSAGTAAASAAAAAASLDLLGFDSFPSPVSTPRPPAAAAPAPAAKPAASAGGTDGLLAAFDSFGVSPAPAPAPAAVAVAAASDFDAFGPSPSAAGPRAPAAAPPPASAAASILSLYGPGHAAGSATGMGAIDSLYPPQAQQQAAFLQQQQQQAAFLQQQQQAAYLQQQQAAAMARMAGGGASGTPFAGFPAAPHFAHAAPPPVAAPPAPAETKLGGDAFAEFGKL